MWTYIRLNNHFSVILCWYHVSFAANGFQKFAISLLKTKFLPNFNTTAPLCKSNSGDPRNFNILSHHSYNHFPFYRSGGVIGQFSLVFALPKATTKKEGFFGGLVLLLYVPVNTYGHYRTVSSPNHFFLCKLEQAVNQYFVLILSLATHNNPS